MSVTVTVQGMNQELGRPVSASQTLAQADGETVVFTAPATGSCLVTLSIANRAERSRYDIRLALSESATAQSSDWLIYDTEIGVGGVLERTGLVLSPGNRLIVSVTENAIPITFSQTLLLGSNTSAGDSFGSSVAVGDSRILVGAPQANSGSGGTYIFDFDGTELAALTSDVSAEDESFGNSVAVGNSRIVVGDSSHNSFRGAAYLFDTAGNQLAKLENPDSFDFGRFGTSVAVGDSIIVVGAPIAGSGDGAAFAFDTNGALITEVNRFAFQRTADGTFGRAVAVGDGVIVVGNPGANSDRGDVYIFDTDGNQVNTITASDGSADDQFGSSLAVGNSRIVVGAPAGNGFAGSVYVFDLNGNQVNTITASDGAVADLFGVSVAIDGSRIIVGARGDDDNGSASGSLYVFDLEGNQQAKLTASTAGDELGTAVGAADGKIVAGARSADTAGSNSGSARIFTENP